MRLLIAENDSSFQEFLKRRLEEKCFAVDTANNAERATKLACENTYDLIVLDHSLPGQGSSSVCTELRTCGCTAPIILTSKTFTLEHKLDSFMAGIDDFVPKPFYFEELHARIGAILRRPRAQHANILTFGDLAMDLGRQTVRRGEHSLYLTRKEFALLEVLVRNSGTIISRGELLEHVWDGGIDVFSRTIETHMANLRRKIDQSGMPRLVHSASGRGYRLGPEK